MFRQCSVRKIPVLRAVVCFAINPGMNRACAWIIAGLLLVSSVKAADSGGDALNALGLTAPERQQAQVKARVEALKKFLADGQINAEQFTDGCRVLEARVQDFEAFVNATRYDATTGMESLRQGILKRCGDTWKSPGSRPCRW
jgi:hypothetical protein